MSIATLFLAKVAVTLSAVQLVAFAVKLVEAASRSDRFAHRDCNKDSNTDSHCPLPSLH
jgi:hypothetical protein